MSEETSNVADEFSELCDAMRDKYEMPESDWKALLDKGMALYARLPKGAIGEDDVQLATNTNALTALDQTRHHLEREFGEYEEQLGDAAAFARENEDSEWQKLAIAAEWGRNSMGAARIIAQFHVDRVFVYVASQGNHGAGVQHLVDAATARLAADPLNHRAVVRMSELLVSPEAAELLRTGFCDWPRAYQAAQESEQ